MFRRWPAVLVILAIGVGAAFSAGAYYGPGVIRKLYAIFQPPPPGTEESRLIKQSRPTDNKKIIVFVHGVTGTPRDTWTAERDGKKYYWPDLVLEDPRFQDYDLLVMSYYTPSLDIGPSISQIAEALQKDLELHKVMPDKTGKSNYDEVIFICHSMANLVIRHLMIVNPLPRTASVRIPLILSVASPSAGSALAEFGRRFSPNQTFAEMSQLETNSFLQLLNEVWKRSAFDTEIACAYEELPDPSLGKLIVEKESATAVCTRADYRGFLAHHISIVKPTGLDHPIHAWLVEQVQKPRAKGAWELDRWASNEIIVGGKDYSESNLHAAMIGLTLRADPVLRDSGLKVNIAYDIGHASRVFDALVNRRIDVYAEYDGSLLHEYLRAPLPGAPTANERPPEKKHLGDDEAVNLELQKHVQTVNLRYLSNFGFNNPYVLVMKRAAAETMGLFRRDGKATITNLAKVSQRNAILISDQEFFYRREWFGLQERYGLRFKDLDHVKHSSIYDRVKQSGPIGVAIVAVGFGSDAELNANDHDLVILEDDKGVLPDYYPAPLVDRLVLRKFEAIEPVLRRLKGIMSKTEMSALLKAHAGLMSGAATAEHKADLTERLMWDFLVRKGIVSGPPAAPFKDREATKVAPAPSPRKKFDLSGHRGARGLCPENTVPAFAKALAIGVTSLEMDAAVTKDGVVVISHETVLDSNITRGPDGRWIDGGRRPVKEITFSELKGYDVGRIRPKSNYAARFPHQMPIDGTRIPSLAEVIELVRASGLDDLLLSIEAKIDPTDDAAPML